MAGPLSLSSTVEVFPCPTCRASVAAGLLLLGIVGPHITIGGRQF